MFWLTSVQGNKKRRGCRSELRGVATCDLDPKLAEFCGARVLVAGGEKTGFTCLAAVRGVGGIFRRTELGPCGKDGSLLLTDKRFARCGRLK